MEAQEQIAGGRHDQGQRDRAGEADDQLAVLPVEGFPIQSNCWIVHPRGKRLSPIAQEFLRHLMDYDRLPDP